MWGREVAYDGITSTKGSEVSTVPRRRSAWNSQKSDYPCNEDERAAQVCQSSRREYSAERVVFPIALGVGIVKAIIGLGFVQAYGRAPVSGVGGEGILR